MKNIYVYPYSLASAKQEGMLDAWRKSKKANIACAKRIEQTISKHFDGMYLDENAAKLVIEEFGFNRVNWVLAATVQYKHYDGRFSRENKEWAKDIFMDSLKEEMGSYVADSHPAVLDGFINQTRRAWQELGLFENAHCVEDSRNLDYKGKVIVLAPKILRDEYRRPDHQLILCDGGFGASPNARGRKVYGKFLLDGENCQFERQDFIGVLKDEHLPEWARENLEQQGEQQNQPEAGMELT